MTEVSLSASALVLALLVPSMALSEVPNRTVEELQQLSSLVVKGRVQRIYSTVEVSKGVQYTRSVAEISVLAVEKGVPPDGLLYARFWRSRWVGDGPAPTTGYGHRGIPAAGNTVRVFLVRAHDDGFDVAPPNGFQPAD